LAFLIFGLQFDRYFIILNFKKIVMFDIGSMVIAGLVMLVSWLVSKRLQSKFDHYSKVFLKNGMSGAEIAEKMLADHGIRDVRVISTPGRLTDHYNPADKTVNLSEAVYNQRNAAAAAVAAHECGHAVQHAQAYQWLTMRSKLVPVVQIASSFMQWVLLAGILMVNTFPSLLLIGIILFATTTLFSVITLPVEYDASNRALAWLKNKNMVNQQEYAGAEDSLKWASRTYLVAAIGSIATLLYYIMRYMGSRD
jgi:Zn-dependent membrane protease YugP